MNAKRRACKSTVVVETEPKILAALPINPVGMVNRNPGVSRMKRIVGTIMLAFMT
jgi:hypothetical protein